MTFETDADRRAAVRAVGQRVQLSRGSSKWNTWAVFDRAFVAVLGTEAYAPAVVLVEDDSYAPNHVGDPAYLAELVDVNPDKIGGYKFDVVGVQPDGTGMVTLVLEAT